MGELRLQRPSHATVVAYLALFVALGGTGYAASKGGGKESVQPTGAGNKVAKGKTSDRRPGARRAQVAGTTTPGQVGAAWGAVNTDGVLSRFASRNVAAVTKAGTGIYCIRLASGLNPMTRGVIATPDFNQDATTFNNASTDRQAVVEWASSGSSCAPQDPEAAGWGIRDELEIQTGIRYADGKIKRADQGFFFSVPGAGEITGLETVTASDSDADSSSLKV